MLRHKKKILYKEWKDVETQISGRIYELQQAIVYADLEWGYKPQYLTDTLSINIRLRDDISTRLTELKL